jgi:hypothetical protein
MALRSSWQLHGTLGRPADGVIHCVRPEIFGLEPALENNS